MSFVRSGTGFAIYTVRMRKIAIIDDDATHRLVLKGLVGDAGYRVVAEGSDGRAAVELCAAEPESRPDVVIMDVKMPVMDGVEAAAVISRTTPVPIVLLTATADAETIRRAVDAGVMGYLTKPVRAEELAPAIELAVERFSETSALRVENEELKNAVESRKTIERAKGVLMDKEGITEAEAFARIRRISMDKRKSMKEIAEVILSALS